MDCKSCNEEITTEENDICHTCYRDPIVNRCTRCNKHHENISYSYVCGDCISKTNTPIPSAIFSKLEKTTKWPRQLIFYVHDKVSGEEIESIGISDDSYLGRELKKLPFEMKFTVYVYQDGSIQWEKFQPGDNYEYLLTKMDRV